MLSSPERCITRVTGPGNRSSRSSLGTLTWQYLEAKEHRSTQITGMDLFGLKADAGEGSCGICLPPYFLRALAQGRTPEKYLGLKVHTLSRRQYPQRRDTINRTSNDFIVTLLNCDRDSFFPRASPLRTSQGHRGNSCHACPVRRRDQRAVYCGAWHALSAPNTFPVPDSSVSQDKPLPRSAPQSPKPVTGNPSRGAASSGAGSGRPHL